MVQMNPYPLRIDKTLMKKIKWIAKRNNRSVNKEIEYVLRCIVEDYEREHGEIAVPIDPEEEE